MNISFLLECEAAVFLSCLPAVFFTANRTLYYILTGNDTSFWHGVTRSAVTAWERSAVKPEPEYVVNNLSVITVIFLLIITAGKSPSGAHFRILPVYYCVQN
jgi:hypothetical protein